MNHREAFKQTLEKFNITAKSLAQKSGVQERQISQFRNGKDLMSETLFSLIAALPNEAKIYYFSCIGGESVIENVDLRSLIMSMSVTRKSELLNLIAESLLENREKSHPVELMQAV